MIKLIDILKESEDQSAKQKVLKYLEDRKSGTLPNTAENKLFQKLIKNITSIDEMQLRDSVRNIFMDRKNTWKTRYIAADLLDVIDGKK